MAPSGGDLGRHQLQVLLRRERGCERLDERIQHGERCVARRVAVLAGQRALQLRAAQLLVHGHRQRLPLLQHGAHADGGLELRRDGAHPRIAEVIAIFERRSPALWRSWPRSLFRRYCAAEWACEDTVCQTMRCTVRAPALFSSDR
eukprot:4166840-Prymnesium_polylepis.2